MGIFSSISGSKFGTVVTWPVPGMHHPWPRGFPNGHGEHLRNTGNTWPGQEEDATRPRSLRAGGGFHPGWWRVIFVAWYGEGAVKPWPLKVPLKNLKSRVEPTVVPFWPKLICVKLAKSTEMGQHIFFLILSQVHVPSFSPWVFKTFSTTGQDEEGRKIFPWPKSFAEIVRGPTETCDVQGIWVLHFE